jgi:hypothetical protein
MGWQIRLKTQNEQRAGHHTENESEDPPGEEPAQRGDRQALRHSQYAQVEDSNSTDEEDNSEAASGADAMSKSTVRILYSICAMAFRNAPRNFCVALLKLLTRPLAVHWTRNETTDGTGWPR